MVTRSAAEMGRHRGSITAGAVLLSSTVFVALIAAACGLSSDRVPAPGAGADVEIESVERAYVTRPFGGSLPVVLVKANVEVDDPAAGSPGGFQATGTDGATYRGGAPLGAKICGIPDYVSDGGGPVRTIGFIVPDGVQLLDLSWVGPGAPDGPLPLPEAETVCSP